MGLEWRRKSYLSWLACACTMTLAVLAWDASAKLVRDRLDTAFTMRAEQIARAISGRMLEHEAVLRGGVALFLASESVSRHEFRAYVRHLEMHRFYPGIQGIGFAKLIPRSELESTIAEVQREGFPQFAVQPAGERPLYGPIIYLEPFEGRNMRAFGFDMLAETARRSAMERAWQTGGTSASRMVKLVQEPDRAWQPGFLLYLPVLRSSTEVRASRARGERPLGFVYMAIRTRDLLTGLLGNAPNDIDYALYESESTAPFLDTRRPERVGSETELSTQRTLEIAGLTWTLRLWSRPNYEPWIPRREPLWVLLAGVVINLLLLYIVRSSSSIDRRAQARAIEMTQELTLSHAREQAQMLVSLREKETLLKEIHHRVKNNLQVVSSLLSLQTNHTLDARAMEPLLQSRQRVLTMAALHEFLYQSTDLSHVDTRAYLTHLASMLANTYQGTAKVELELELDDIALDLDHAIPCGLITNELITNAYKYAFAERRTGKLTVGLRKSGDDIVLEIADDGPGLPARVDSTVPSTLGLQLVRLLSEQLHARLTVSSEAGTRYTIAFRIARARAAA
jgi:two-component sensor histidine kinase